MSEGLTEAAFFDVMQDLYNAVGPGDMRTITMSTGTMDRVDRIVREGNALRRYRRHPALQRMTQRQISRATGRVRLPVFEPISQKKKRRRRQEKVS
jgi:hypothetical protein